MPDKLLTELKEIKLVLARLVGSSKFPGDQQFSKDALNKAAKQFHKMNVQRGEWVQESDLSKFIKGAYWAMGKQGN